MQSDLQNASEPDEVERYELHTSPLYHFGTSRREFVQTLGAGLVIAIVADGAQAQRGDRRRRSSEGENEKLSERFHIGRDGVVTVMTSKVDVGQGCRTQITQAAAEELRVPLEQIQLIMADTALCPDDGGTAGGRTTPATVPRVQRAAALAREVLCDLAAEKLEAVREAVRMESGTFLVSGSDKRLSLAELAQDEELTAKLDAAPRRDVTLARVSEWRILGQSVSAVQSKAVVTGAAVYPSDVKRSDMMYGKVLRAPALGAILKSVDLRPAEAIEGVTVVRDDNFVGCTASSSWTATKALSTLAATASWELSTQPSSDELFDHLKRTANEQPRTDEWGKGVEALLDGDHEFHAQYTIAYIQHAPMEPRAAVAEWSDGKLTVWTGTQQPSRVQEELKSAFRLADEQVRVIVPDTGGGFGGKHSGEAAVEAARLAKAAGRPISLCWTRDEEFTWAYCRPAGLIEVRASMSQDGSLVAWDFANYNSGGSAIKTPYEIPHGRTQFFETNSPLRQGSYRALASTANTFARESAMDELASLANLDPLEFRLQHLPDGRLKEVLKAAADKFGWRERRKSPQQNRGIGLSCGTEKGSFVAACVEVELVDGQPKVRSVCQAFECGAIQNPGNLNAQVEGCLIMGLGGALTEEMRFKDGKLETASFSNYRVPRMSDVPKLDIVLIDRPDLSSVGAGETPIIAVAPAIANAMVHAGGTRVRSMPLLRN